MQKSNFIYVIPSYNRVNKQITVNYLNEIGIPKDRIYVFVQTKEDEQAYLDKIGDKANIIFKTASRGVEARNNILNTLVEENNLLMLDDDIRAIGEFNGDKIEKIVSSQKMDEVFSKCFEICEKSNIKIFGIYPIYNYFFLERTISTKCTVNTVFGYVKGFKGRYNENYDTKEDAEICARMLSMNRSIFRFNFLAVDADHRKTKDGYIDDWHQEENIRCVKKLLKDFPKIFKEQKNKPWEVRNILKDKKIILPGYVKKVC